MLIPMLTFLVEGDHTADDDDCPNIFDIIDNLMIK